MTAISLPNDLEDWARSEVAAGRAASIEAFVAGVLRQRRANLEEMRRLIAEGIESGEKEGWIDGDVMTAELSRWIDEDEAEAERQERAQRGG